jgi:hypothetical protein
LCRLAADPSCSKAIRGVHKISDNLNDFIRSDITLIRQLACTLVTQIFRSAALDDETEVGIADSNRMTWCRVQKLCINSGEGRQPVIVHTE